MACVICPSSALFRWTCSPSIDTAMMGLETKDKKANNCKASKTVT